MTVFDTSNHQIFPIKSKVNQVSKLYSGLVQSNLSNRSNRIYQVYVAFPYSDSTHDYIAPVINQG